MAGAPLLRVGGRGTEHLLPRLLAARSRDGEGRGWQAVGHLRRRADQMGTGWDGELPLRIGDKDEGFAGKEGVTDWWVYHNMRPRCQ